MAFWDRKSPETHIEVVDLDREARKALRDFESARSDWDKTQAKRQLGVALERLMPDDQAVTLGQHLTGHYVAYSEGSVGLVRNEDGKVMAKVTGVVR